MDKKAMDAAIGTALKQDRERLHGVYAAVEFVRPWVGELPNVHAFDSAGEVYGRALKVMNVAHEAAFPADALRAILAAQPKPGERREVRKIAADAAPDGTDFAKMFPGAARIELR